MAQITLGTLTNRPLQWLFSSCTSSSSSCTPLCLWSYYSKSHTSTTDWKRHLKRKRQIDSSEPKEGSAEDRTKRVSLLKWQVTTYCNLSAQFNSVQDVSQHRTIQSCLKTCSLAVMMSLNRSKDLPPQNKIRACWISTWTVLCTTLKIQTTPTKWSSHTDKDNHKKITNHLRCLSLLVLQNCSRSLSRSTKMVRRHPFLLALKSQISEYRHFLQSRSQILLDSERELQTETYWLTSEWLNN